MQASFAFDLAETAVSQTIAWGGKHALWVWSYHEGMTDCYFDRLEAVITGEDAWWQRWPHGRLFGPDSELAWWQQTDGRYKLRLLLASGTPPDHLSWSRSETWTKWGDVVPTLLHGRLDKEKAGQGVTTPLWYEARIPGELNYPVAVDPNALTSTDTVRAVLETQTYASGTQVGLTHLIQLTTRTIPEGSTDVG